MILSKRQACCHTRVIVVYSNPHGPGADRGTWWLAIADLRRDWRYDINRLGVGKGNE